MNKVNFRVEDCVHTIAFNKEMTALHYISKYRLKKIASESSADYWSINEWDAETAITDIAIDKHSSNVICCEPRKKLISGGRYEHVIEFMTPQGEGLPVGYDPIEFTLSYKKPLTKGVNYSVFKPLLFLDLHLIQFDPIRLFNACDHLRYRVVDHDELEIISSLPPTNSEPNGACVFYKRGLEPDETFSLSAILCQKKLTSKLATKTAKIICRILLAYIT
ncbi:MAG: hypothetical protein WC334_07065 [Kiritimatiellales bacterium]